MQYPTQKVDIRALDWLGIEEIMSHEFNLRTLVLGGNSIIHDDILHD